MTPCNWAESKCWKWGTLWKWEDEVDNISVKIAHIWGRLHSIWLTHKTMIDTNMCTRSNNKVMSYAYSPNDDQYLICTRSNNKLMQIEQDVWTACPIEIGSSTFETKSSLSKCGQIQCVQYSVYQNVHDKVCIILKTKSHTICQHFRC